MRTLFGVVFTLLSIALMGYALLRMGLVRHGERGLGFLHTEWWSHLSAHASHRDNMILLALGLVLGISGIAVMKSIARGR